MRVAKVIALTVEERASLTKGARGRSTPTRLVLRAKVVLAAADGQRNDEIATDPGCTRRTVGTWRNRFVADRLAGIERDAPRSGRAPSVRAVKEAAVIAKTTRETPAHATQWSVRTMAELEQAIHDDIAHHNAHPKTVVWPKKAEDILAKVAHARSALYKIPTE